MVKSVAAASGIEKKGFGFNGDLMVI